MENWFTIINVNQQEKILLDILNFKIQKAQIQHKTQKKESDS